MLNTIANQCHSKRQVTGLCKGGKPRKLYQASYEHFSSTTQKDSMSPCIPGPKTWQIWQHQSDSHNHIVHKEKSSSHSLECSIHDSQALIIFSQVSVQSLVQRRLSRIVTNWAWCHIPMISALGSQSSLCSRSQASQGYKARSSPERKEGKEKEGRRETEGREKGLLKEIMNN